MHAVYLTLAERITCFLEHNGNLLSRFSAFMQIFNPESFLSQRLIHSSLDFLMLLHVCMRLILFYCDSICLYLSGSILIRANILNDYII